MKLTKAKLKRIILKEIEQMGLAFSGPEEAIQALKAASGQYLDGPLNIKVSRGNAVLSYAGNMGSDVRGIDKVLAANRIPSVEELKSIFPGAVEDGSPDYRWRLELPLK